MIDAEEGELKFCEKCGNHEVPLVSQPAQPAKGWHSWLRRNGRGKKIPEMENKKSLFALKKEKKKRVHRISCSAFCRQSYPPPILLGDCWLEARNAFHFLPSLPELTHHLVPCCPHQTSQIPFLLTKATELKQS